MAVAVPVDVAVNPNNTAQRYILWSHGRIDAIGGAPPITESTTWYTRADPPAVAIHITNWATGQGYVLDYRGGVSPLNGAPNVGASETPTVMPGVPLSPQLWTRVYVDWSWDPAGTGQGYILDGYGKLWPFGGAAAPPRTGARWSSLRARRLQMRWTPSKLAITADLLGNLYGDWSAPVGAVASTWGRPKLSSLRDFVVMDWTTGSGYLLHKNGSMHVFGSRTRPFGWPYKAGGDLARTLAVISADDPETFWEVWTSGQSFDFVSSTPPTVVAGGSDPVSPAATVTDSTRPDLLFDYSDPQGDQMRRAQGLVFTQAFVAGHDMSDPLVWINDALVAVETVDPNARGFASPVDYANVALRFYARAQDSALQWSDWDDHGWTQSVPAPPTPTGLTATPNQATFTVALSVSTSAGSADLVRFEASDDGGTTWGLVRGAEAIPRTTVTTATDYDAPLGVTRTYRAVAYAVDPRVTSAPSSTATATLTTKTYVLTATDDPSLGGRVWVQDPVAWVRPMSGGTFWGIGADYPTRVKDGRTPRARRATVQIFVDTLAAWQKVEDLVLSGSTLVYRDPRGGVRYCEIDGDWSGSAMKGTDQYNDLTELPLVEIAPPIADV